MPMGCGRGIHDGGFRLNPCADHFPAHGTGGKPDTSVAAYAFHLPSVRQGIDIQDSPVFSKPHWRLDWCPIPFKTLQVEISLSREGGKAWARHGNTFMLDEVGMSACHIIPGRRRLSAQAYGCRRELWRREVSRKPSSTSELAGCRQGYCCVACHYRLYRRPGRIPLGFCV
jgi:hypothetical protein